MTYTTGNPRKKNKTANEPTISIKVLVDKVKKRVVYVEADHTFVDILFSFMTLPMGTIVRLLRKLDDKEFEALGSLNNLYQSLKDLPRRYLATEECKSMLLNPRSLSYDHCINLKLQIDDTKPIEYFTCCARKNKYYSICKKAKCKTCGELMLDDPNGSDSDSNSDSDSDSDSDSNTDTSVFVSDVTTFIVTDDLSVMPYSAAGSIRLLEDIGIKDMSNVEQRNIDMGCEEILGLLRMAFALDHPLTYSIFGKTNTARNLLCPDKETIFNKCGSVKKEMSTSSNMLLEVSLQKSTGKLLYAEAKEDFVEFLFTFLSLPLGTVIGKFMNGASSVSCMDNLFKSISNMSVGRYLKSQEIKDMLLKPHFGQQYTSKISLFPLKGTVNTKEFKGIVYKLKDPRIDEKFLTQSGMFLVSDDLVVVPSSSKSIMNTLNKLKVQFDDIERHEISIGLEEGLGILKASLRSKATLTSIIGYQRKK